MEYWIQAEQSSLIEIYNKDDMVIRDPVALKGKDWSRMIFIFYFYFFRNYPYD